jgi:hypothetical protein
MDRPRRRALEVAAPVAAVLGAMLLVVALGIFIGSAGFGYDFAAYDGAARRILAGNALYLPNTAQLYAAGAYEGLYLYPPPMAIALAPLAMLSSGAATMAWLVVRLVLLGLGCAVLPVGRTTRLLTFAVACVTFPVLFDLNLGNVSVVVFALSAVAWRSMESPVAALAHAALIAIRFPFGLFFIEWLVERRFRRIAWTIGAGVLLIALSLPIVGVGTYLDYVTILRALPDISTGPHNLSLKSTALALGAPGSWAALLVPLGSLAGLAAVLYAARRRDRDVAFVVTATATLLVAPFIHPHYLVLLLLPAALLVERGRAWALALPLLGWLPDPALPLIAPIAIGLVLTLPRAAGEVHVGRPVVPAASAAT